MKGLFVVVEGFEGVGKSSFVRWLEEALSARGVGCITTRQPGGTPVAERIRKVFLEKTAEPIGREVETLLLYAARKQLLDQVIDPAIAQGKVVISDRHTLSTYAYQNVVETELERRFSREPDLTIYLHAPFEVAMARVAARQDLDRKESQSQEQLLEIYRNYQHGIGNLAADKLIRLDCTDFAAPQYLDGRELIVEAILQRHSAPVSIKEFEKKVFAVEGVRVIIRADQGQSVSDYHYATPLPDDATYGDLQARLQTCIRTFPFAVSTTRLFKGNRSGYHRLEPEVPMFALRQN